MSLDNELTADVSDELFWDPKVDNAEIAVSANDGTITLRGTVGSLRQKREAKKAAQRVFGVISVDNQLQVKLMNDDKRAEQIVEVLGLDPRREPIEGCLRHAFIQHFFYAQRRYRLFHADDRHLQFAIETSIGAEPERAGGDRDQVALLNS